MANPDRTQPPRVTDAELAVLEFLWEVGSASVRAIADRLYPGGGNSEQATVQKLCERLAAKDCVDCDRTMRPRTYRASVARADLIRGQLEDVAERFCSGSLVPLLSHLVAGGEFSAKEIAALRAQIDELDRSASGKTGKSRKTEDREPRRQR